MRRQKIKVLVIDNDLLFLQLLTRYLQLEGYEVDAASMINGLLSRWKCTHPT